MDALEKNRLINEAIIFAVNAHADAFRKGTELPYILHPAEVAAIAAGIVNEKSICGVTDKDKSEIIAAAVLHDTVEDTPVTKEQLAELFGENVAFLVASESEDKREHLPAESTWKERKQETLNHLEGCTDIRVKIIAFADKLSNLRAMYRDYRNIGDELWQRFNQHDPQMHGWYYAGVMKACPELKDTAAFEEYARLMKENIFGM